MRSKLSASTPALIAILFVFAGFTSSATAAVPAAPANPLAACHLQDQTSLSWTATSGATSYNVYRGNSSGNENQIASNVPSNFYEDANLSDGTTYYYEVTAVNGSGEGSKSAEVSATTQPGGPNNFIATAGDSQVTLQWSASASATSYRIYRDTLGGVSGSTDFLVTGTSYNDAGLINGTLYYYVIVPVNGSGEAHSTWAQASATPKASSGSEPPTGPPTSIAVTAGNSLNVLNWKPSSNASSYDIYRGTTSGSETSWKTGLTALTYSDTGLTNGTTYYYKVRADNGGNSSSLSSEVSAAPYIPAAPTNLTISAGSSLVALKWTATGTSYAVYRSTAAGAETLLDSGLTGSTYSDANVTNGTMYFYKVQALNPGGTGALSTEVSATPTGSAPQSSTVTVNYNLPGEPIQTCSVTIPDINRPVQAAMLKPEGSNMQALATKYNAAIIGIDGFTYFNFGTPSNPINLATPNDTSHTICVLDYRWPQLGALRIQAVLNAVAAMFPAHPEIANTGLLLYGFSEGTDNVNLVVSPSYSTQSNNIQPSPLANRVLAIVNESELDEDVVNPVATMDTAPHLFLSSSFSDQYSSLNLNLSDLVGISGLGSVTYDTVARGLATNQGAPLTVIDNVGAGHGGNEDNPFVSVWMDAVLSQRLPAALPTSTPVSLPSWQNTSSWVGTYNVSTSSSSPWSGGIQLTSNLVSSKSSYTDSRKFTWLPSQNMANTWLNYSNTGSSTAFNPVIISSTSATGVPGSMFTYQITATNEPTSYSASNLPSWLSLNTTTGVLSGTPPSTSSSTITLQANNAEGTGSATLLVTVSASTQTPQTISAFGTISSVTYGAAPFTITLPTASSGLPVTVTVQSGPATLSGNTITITGAGTVLLAANQAGNATYSAAPPVTTSFTVSQESQTITFPAIANQIFGVAPFTLSATASSGLPVSYSIVSGSATILGGLITLTGSGPVTVQASQAGNANYLAATSVTQSFTVNISTVTPETFAQWDTTYGLTGASALPTATPEKDGVTNLMKYLCDINPTIPMTAATRAALPTFSVTTISGTEYITLTYRQNAAATGLTIQVQTSPNLSTWTTVNPPALSQQIGIDPTTLDPIMEVGVKATGAAQQFIRLLVTQP